MDFVVASGIEDAVGIKARHPGRAAFMAGGTDLVLRIKKGVSLPELVIQLPLESGLVERRGAVLALPATKTMTELLADPLVQREIPLLVEALSHVGSPQIRNRATLGGNLVNASPASDSAPALLVLKARVNLVSATGTRLVPLDEFFLGPGKTVLGSDELLSEVLVEIPDATALCRFRKFGPRGSNVIASANFAACVRVESGVVVECRLAAGSVAPRPIRLNDVETLLLGEPVSRFSDSTYRKAVASKLDETIRPISDVRGSNWYKNRVVELALLDLLSWVASGGREV